jgi:hypothetical protein
MMKIKILGSLIASLNRGAKNMKEWTSLGFRIKTGVREDGSKYNYIDAKEHDREICAFCGSKNLGSGSWSPEYCKDCGAVHFFGQWVRDM